MANPLDPTGQLEQGDYDYYVGTGAAKMYGGLDPNTGLLINKYTDNTRSAFNPEWLKFQQRVQSGGQAEAARQAAADDGGLFGGGLGGLLGLGLGIYGLGSLGGLWGAGAGAGASGFGAGELLGGAESLSGLSAANSLSAAGLGGAAAPTFAGNIFGQNVYPGVLDSVPSAAGTTGGGMDWWSELGLTPQDVGLEVSPWTTNPSMSDLTGGILTDAGSLATPGTLEQLKTWAANNPGSVAKLAGQLGSTALGMYGANKQASALQGLANKYENFGGPSRARFDASMTPGFDPMSIPGYAGALDTTSKSLLARLSAQGGNPFGNPGGLIDANKQIVSGTALPAIQEYQRLNANTGFGSSMNAAANLGSSAIGADRGFTTALASGLGDIFNQPSSLEQVLETLKNSGIKLNFGL